MSETYKERSVSPTLQFRLEGKQVKIQARVWQDWYPHRHTEWVSLTEGSILALNCYNWIIILPVRSWRALLPLWFITQEVSSGWYHAHSHKLEATKINFLRAFKRSDLVADSVAEDSSSLGLNTRRERRALERRGQELQGCCHLAVERLLWTKGYRLPCSHLISHPAVVRLRARLNQEQRETPKGKPVWGVS